MPTFDYFLQKYLKLAHNSLSNLQTDKQTDGQTNTLIRIHYPSSLCNVATISFNAR